jgi:hypothetical protein
MKSELDVKITCALGILFFALFFYFYKKTDFLSFYEFGSQAVAITALIRYIFIKWLWKRVPFLELLHKVPNLEGEWVGFYESTYNTPNKRGEIKVIISQPSIFEIKIKQISSDSDSRSISESLSVENDGDTKLSYIYLVEPKATLKHKHQISFGSAIYSLKKDSNKLTLKGNYWTDQKTTGYSELEKV